jgi:hypothetical protein
MLQDELLNKFNIWYVLFMLCPLCWLVEKLPFKVFQYPYRWQPVKYLYVGYDLFFFLINPLNAELNPICHLLALLEAHHILYVSRIRVNMI